MFDKANVRLGDQERNFNPLTCGYGRSTLVRTARQSGRPHAIRLPRSMRRAHTAMVGAPRRYGVNAPARMLVGGSILNSSPEQRGQVRVGCTNEAGQREDEVGAAERGGGHQCPDHKAGGANAAGGDGDQPGR